MKLEDYKLRPNYKIENEQISKKYDEMVNQISLILEEASANGKKYGDDCFFAYQTFFGVCNEDKKTVLDSMKEWHEQLDCYMTLFAYDKAVCEKMQILSNEIENLFEEYSNMIDNIEKIKKAYDEKIQEYKSRNVSLNPITKEEMEKHFLQTASSYFDIEYTMQDFIDEKIKPKIDLCDIISSMELDFNEAVMFHKVNQRIDKVEESNNEDNRL